MDLRKFSNLKDIKDNDIYDITKILSIEHAIKGRFAGDIVIMHSSIG